MKIDGKIYKNASGKNTSFFVKNYFSLEVVSPVNSDLTVNNTHNQSLASFAPNISAATLHPSLFTESRRRHKQ